MASTCVIRDCHSLPVPDVHAAIVGEFRGRRKEDFQVVLVSLLISMDTSEITNVASSAHLFCETSESRTLAYSIFIFHGWAEEVGLSWEYLRFLPSDLPMLPPAYTRMLFGNLLKLEKD